MNARKRIQRFTNKMKQATDSLNIAQRKLNRMRKKNEQEARRLI